METIVKTIDIQAKEWFDKVNGNSYFAGLVTVNYGMKDAKEFIMPFQYGYGDAYRYEAMMVLKREFFNIPETDNLQPLLKDVIIRYDIVRGCKKRELKDCK